MLLLLLLLLLLPALWGFGDGSCFGCCCDRCCCSSWYCCCCSWYCCCCCCCFRWYVLAAVSTTVVALAAAAAAALGNEAVDLRFSVVLSVPEYRWLFPFVLFLSDVMSFFVACACFFLLALGPGVANALEWNDVGWRRMERGDPCSRPLRLSCLRNGMETIWDLMAETTWDGAEWDGMVPALAPRACHFASQMEWNGMELYGMGWDVTHCNGMALNHMQPGVLPAEAPPRECREHRGVPGG